MAENKLDFISYNGLLNYTFYIEPKSYSVQTSNRAEVTTGYANNFIDYLPYKYTFSAKLNGCSMSDRAKISELIGSQINGVLTCKDYYTSDQETPIERQGVITNVQEDEFIGFIGIDEPAQSLTLTFTEVTSRIL